MAGKDAVYLVLICMCACNENPMGGIVPEPPGSPFVEYRSWSNPSLIEAAPIPFANGYNLVSSISSGADGLIHVLYRAPGDSLVPNQILRLGYLRYEDSRWRLMMERDEAGEVSPSVNVSTSNGVVHLFWSGVLPEERGEWLTQPFRTTTIFHCVWEGATCSSTRVLSKRFLDAPTASIRVHGASKNASEQISVVIDNASVTELITLNNRGDVLRKIELRVLTLNSLPANDTLHLAYVAPPQGGGSALDVFYRFEHVNALSEPVLVFHEDGHFGQIPQLQIDRRGIYHMLFIVTSFNLYSYRVFHVYSGDRGATWSTPEQIGETMGPLLRLPSFVIDTYGVLHAAWNAGRFEGDEFRLDTFYATRRDTIWSEPTLMFPTFEFIEPVWLTVRNGIEIHAVFSTYSDGRLYHAVYQ